MTPAERAARATSLGASEVPVIARLPGAFGSELLVWAEKLGHLPPEVRAADVARGIDMPPPPPDREQWYVRLGNLLEEPLAQAFAERTGLTVGPSPGMVRHPKLPWVSATPDRIVEAGTRRELLEIKKRRTTDGWGEDGSDIIAPSVFAQVQWQLFACLADLAHVAALFGGVEFRTYTVEPDPTYQNDLLDIGSAWWDRHVVGRERPQIDGSEETQAFLQKWYPPEAIDEGAELTPAQAYRIGEFASQYSSCSREIAALGEVKAKAANEIRALMGHVARTTGDWGEVSWRSQRGSPPWKQIAMALDDVRAADMAKAMCTPHRVLRVEYGAGDG